MTANTAPMPVSPELARRAQDQGDDRRCEVLCAEIIAAGGGNADVECLRGTSLLAREGRAAEALSAFEAALGHNPQAGAAHRGRIFALLRLGQLDVARDRFAEIPLGGESTNSLRRVIARLTDASAEIEPADGLLLGQALNGMRRYDEAAVVLEATADGGNSVDDDLRARLALTRTYGGLGRLDDILETCRRLRDRALAAAPGRRRYYLGEVEMLARSLDSVRSGHALTLALLGGVLVEITSTYAEGCSFLNRVEKMAPDLPDLYLGAGMARMMAGDFEQAAAHLRRAVDGMDDFEEPSLFLQLIEAVGETDPNGGGANTAPVSALLLYAEALAAALRLRSAEAVLALAAKQAPDAPEVHTLHAAVLMTLGRTKASLAAALRARDLNPNHASANMEVATNLLSLGRLGEAWDLFDHRLTCWRRDTKMRTFSIPQWEGEALEGRTLLIWREEGVGDEIRFASILPELRAQSDGELIVECGDRLMTLFERSFPDVTFRLEQPDDPAPAGVELQLPMMSLPRLFRRDIRDFPGAGAFLTADPVRVAAWRDRFAALGERPLVGIGWRSLNQSWRKRPLLTELADWDAIIGRRDLSIINLQCEEYAEDIAAAEDRLGRSIYVVDDKNLKNDLEEAAALMACLDVVLGARCWVPTTAAAVGTKAFCVTPRPNPFMMDLDYDPWSPTTRFFYRDFDDGWGKVVGQVSDAVDAYLKEQGS